MQLVHPTNQHLLEMMTWFDNQESVFLWAGPNFRFPYTLESFRHDLKLDSLTSYALVNPQGQLLAFGQYYLRIGRCHFGRLVVSPAHRGQGLIGQLLTQLEALGKAELNTSESSLFVLETNLSAVNAYLKYGFGATQYPDTIPIEQCLYLIKAS